MRKKRIMVIGPTNCGKTTLVNALNDEKGRLRKTQNIIYGEHTMDVPASYIENPWLYNRIISAAQDASHILILVDQSHCIDVYSPGFAKVFTCPVIGVITKVDLNPENEKKCIRQLEKIGISQPYFKICVPSGEGISGLKEFLFEKKDSKEGSI